MDESHNGGLSEPAVGPGYVTVLRCLRCGQVYRPEEIDYVCDCRPNQGSDLGTLDVLYDYLTIAQTFDVTTWSVDRVPGIGRYWPLLPIADRASLPSLAVGDTPLLNVPRLAEDAGLQSLWIKDDGRNPSASLKDRASAIAVAKTCERGSPIVATASTGNAAAALAGQCAAAGQATVIFVPRTAPPAKIAQLRIYGATVLAVDGGYDEAFDLCTAACAEFGWYNRNTGYNPYMTEGKKTVAYEIAEQLTQQREGSITGPTLQVPDVIFVSVGDGCIIGGIHKGFSDLVRLGWTDQMPRLYGVQSTRSAALAHAWAEGLEVPEPVEATTRADSISVNAPRDPVKALRAVRETGGAFVTVEDREILQAMLPMARMGAVFAEPAGATAYAGLVAAVDQGLVLPTETVVVVNTGNGLKDVGAAMEAAGEPIVIAPELTAVRHALAELRLDAT